ncbi:cation transporter [Treponema parvum]|uniref:Cation transporter n=1 Tax=Treponema parvum TaxID=138851 RepID=A0A975F2R9_9SPIR|nr:cation transporter [Treponema parvum]QTQ13565.1 cation transporter [Treponema parvum]
MKTLSVPDMRCEKCVANITKAFDSAGIEHKIVDLSTKTVDVADSFVEKACSVLEDIGFPASLK